MADFNEPTNTSLYSSIWSTVRTLIASCIKLDPSSDSNIPTNAVRHSSASSNKFQKWNGSSWVDADVHFGNAVGIGTTSPSTGVKLQVSRTDAQTNNNGTILAEYTGATTTVSCSVNVKNATGTSQFMQWEANGLRIGSRVKTGSGTGAVTFTYGNDSEAGSISSAGNWFLLGAKDDLIASSANCYISSTDGRIQRITSSGRYKKDIEPIQPELYERVLELEEVWYRSKSSNDRPDWSFYGCIAEQVAQVDPRLVHWGYTPDSFEEVEYEDQVQIGEDENGEAILETRTFKRTQLKADESQRTLQPEGVMYDRLAVLMLPILRRHKEELAELKAKVAALEAKAG